MMSFKSLVVFFLLFSFDLGAVPLIWLVFIYFRFQKSYLVLSAKVSSLWLSRLWFLQRVLQRSITMTWRKDPSSVAFAISLALVLLLPWYAKLDHSFSLTSMFKLHKLIQLIYRSGKEREWSSMAANSSVPQTLRNPNLEPSEATWPLSLAGINLHSIVILHKSCSSHIHHPFLLLNINIIGLISIISS